LLSPSSFPEWATTDLDAAYSPSTVVPDFLDVLREYRERSDAAKAALRCELDVEYGSGPAERLHLFPPPRAGNPLVVFVHGGHWQDLSIDDSCFAAPDLVCAGAGLVVLGYQTAPSGTLDAMVCSIATGLDWVVEHAVELGGRPDAVHAAGSSAGAHLVAMATSSAAGTAVTSLAGVVLLSGTYDLGLIPRTYVNCALGLDEETARRLSPVRALPMRVGEVLVARGGGETAEYVRQHGLLLDALEAEGDGVPVQSLVSTERNHFDLPLGLADPTEPLGCAVLSQLARSPS
jgi:arylformamidase